jgi:hypothetical protein
MPAAFYGEEPPEYRQPREEHYRRAELFNDFANTDFNEPSLPSKLKRKINESDYIVPLIGGVSGLILGATAFWMLDKQESDYYAQTPQEIPETPTTTTTAPLPIDSQPPFLDPNFEISHNELAVAHAAMLDFSLEAINKDGALESVKSNLSGGLIERNGSLYFGTAKSVITDASGTVNEQHKVRVKVPTGLGYDIQEYVIDAVSFTEVLENENIVLARFDNVYDGLLLQAISEGRITPIKLTGERKAVGFTVVGDALQETPFLDGSGFVHTRTIRHNENLNGPVTYENDEIYCSADIEEGDFVLKQDSKGRIIPESYGVVLSDEIIDDPHYEDTCITKGKVALNALIHKV